MTIFPPTKSQITRYETRTDDFVGDVVTRGEIRGLIPIPAPGLTLLALHSLTITFEVWGREAAERIQTAFREREEIDLNIGI